MSDIKEKIESELKTVKSMCETMENAIKTQLDRGLDDVDTHEMYEAVDIYKDLSEVKKNIIDGCYKMQIMEAMEEAGEEDEDGEEMRYYRGQPRSSRTGRFMRRESRRGYESMYPMEYYRDMDRMEGKMYYNGGGQSGGSGGQSGGSGGSGGGQSGGNRGYSEGYSEGQNRGYEEGNRRGYEEGNRRGYEEGNRRGYDEGYNRGYSEGQRSGGSGGSGGRSNSRSESARRNYEETKAMHNTNTTEDKQQKVRMLEKYVNELSSDIMTMMSDATNEEKTMLKSKLTTLANKIV